MGFYRNEFVDFHFAGGKSTSLIKGDSIYPSEGLDGIEVLDEDFLPAQADSGEGENRTSEENEAFRDHVNKGGYGASDCDFGGGVGDAEAGPENERADGDESETDVFNNVVHDGKQFRVGGFDGVGVLFKLVDEILLADGGGGGLTGAGNDETARGEFVAFSFSDIFLFTSDEGFVNLDGSLFYAGVDNDLVAEAKDKKVVFDYLIGGDLARFAVADDGGLLFREDSKFIDSFLGANFVDDANESVGDGDENKKEVFVGANGDNHEGEDEVDEVEDGEGVSEDNFGEGVLGFI